LSNSRTVIPEKEKIMFAKIKPGEAVIDSTPEHFQHSTSATPSPTAQSSEAISSISSGMKIVGKIVGDGFVKVLGSVEGELHATNVLICEGAQVDGNIVAQELTIGGRVKGTIHAVRVKLEGTAEVEGDIFHRSLSIEENARFEGSSRREDNLPDTALSVPAKGSQLRAPPQVALPDGNRKSNGTSGSAMLNVSAG
jgi:cytoskeletal protein CcmA (bactofilin family)